MRELVCHYKVYRGASNMSLYGIYRVTVTLYPSHARGIYMLLWGQANSNFSEIIESDSVIHESNYK